MKNIINSILTLFILILAPPFVIAENEQQPVLDLTIVPIQEVDLLFSGVTAISINESTGGTIINNYYNDGKITSNRGNKKLEGFWYTDFEGNHCVKWHKNIRPNCGVIMKDDDGNWIRVKNTEIDRRYIEFRETTKDTDK